MKKPLLLAVAVCPILMGCLFPWMLPTVKHIPPAELGEPSGEIAAFYCDISTDHRQFIGGSQTHTIAMEIAERKKLDRTPRKVRGDIEHGLALVIADVNATYKTSCLKLYRRGYATVVLDARDDHEKITWVKLETEEELFQSIRDLLLATPVCSAPVDPKTDWIPTWKKENKDNVHPRIGWNKQEKLGLGQRSILRPGSHSEEHKKCLEFAKGECETLLAKPGLDGELRKRVEYQLARLDELLVQ